MTLLDVYKTFLLHPSADLLADDARFTYVTSLQVFNGSAAILHHLVQSSRLLKKSENIISAHQAADSVVLETSTTIEYLNGTGSYVHGLDKNFVVDNTVTLPIIHSVVFQNGKIKSIRLFWDQGTMLKQINIIGTRGNIWPIFNGIEQEKLLVSDATPSDNPSPQSATIRATPSPPKKQYDVSEQEPDAEMPYSRPAVVPPSESSKPPSRSFQDIVDSQTGPVPRSPARQGTAPQSVDIFANSDTPEQIRAKRIFNQKNFEPHWKFGTPEKPLSPYTKTRANMKPQPDELTWDYDSKTGKPEPQAGQFRKDLYSQFEISDQSPMPQGRFEGIKIHGNGMGSHSSRPQWHIGMGLSDDEEESVEKKTTTPFSQSSNNSNIRKDIYSDTDLGAKSPVSATTDRFQGINIQGNGMGSRAGKTQWTWAVEDDEEISAEAQKYEPQTAHMRATRNLVPQWAFSGEEDKEN
ncbi:hypothetical protein V1511DRAFT_496953 [Dipodascopsis uninucleata]